MSSGKGIRAEKGLQRNGADHKPHNLLHGITTGKIDLPTRTPLSRRARRDTFWFLLFIAPNFILLGVFVFWPIL